MESTRREPARERVPRKHPRGPQIVLRKDLKKLLSSLERRGPPRGATVSSVVTVGLRPSFVRITVLLGYSSGGDRHELVGLRPNVVVAPQCSIPDTARSPHLVLSICWREAFQK